MKLLLLTKENIPLARGEAEALLGEGTLDENILLINTKKSTDRLAYTRIITNILFESKKNELEKNIKSFNWNKIITKTFACSYRNDEVTSHTNSRLYGGMIYDTLRKPKVNLEKPDTHIFIFETKKKCYVGTLDWEDTDNFNLRSPKLWPAQKPITMQPRIARACVNLTGAVKSIYDPMCGIGGFLIEAGVMGLQINGSDVDKRMTHATGVNLRFFKIKKYNLFTQDVLKMKKKYEYIVTDLPYGKNTKNVDKMLYPEFIKVLGKNLKKRAVIVLPDFAHGQRLFKNSKLKIKAKYKYYLHASLSREIFVIEPQ